MKDIAVVLLTYASGLDSPRHLYATRTMEALRQHLKYSGNIHYHIADDGSPMEHVVALAEPGDTSTSSERRGYGANFNLATQVLHNDYQYFLMVEDDWELTRDLDLDPLVDAIDAGLNCIRLGYLGWTQALYGEVVARAKQTFLLLDPMSPEPHVWSGHPRLESRTFQRIVGPWPEGYDPGTTEFFVSQRPPSRVGVAWPLDLGIRAGQIHGTLFEHIGAVQAREDQIASTS